MIQFVLQHIASDQVGFYFVIADSLGHRFIISFMPAVNDLDDFKFDIIPKKASGGFICFVSGIAFHLYWYLLHPNSLILIYTRVFGRLLQNNLSLQNK